MSNGQRAVLVTPNIRVWDARTRDAQLSKEVADSKNTSDRWVRVWKDLLPDCDALGKLQSIRTKARRFHYDNTFAYHYRGTGILPIKNFEFYTDKMKVFEDEYMGYVPVLVSEYEMMQDELHNKLGGAYKETDYPSSEIVQSRFGFQIIVTAIPEGGLNLPEELSDEIRADIEFKARESERSAYVDANKDLRARLFDVANTIEGWIRDPKGLKPASIQSLDEILGVLGRLNMDDDESFEKLLYEARKRFEVLSGVAASKSVKKVSKPRKSAKKADACTADSTATDAGIRHAA